jgi:hypothetical protein
LAKAHARIVYIVATALALGWVGGCDDANKKLSHAARTGSAGQAASANDAGEAGMRSDAAGSAPVAAGSDSLGGAGADAGASAGAGGENSTVGGVGGAGGEAGLGVSNPHDRTVLEGTDAAFDVVATGHGSATSGNARVARPSWMFPAPTSWALTPALCC